MYDAGQSPGRDTRGQGPETDVRGSKIGIKGLMVVGGQGPGRDACRGKGMATAPRQSGEHHSGQEGNLPLPII